MENQLSEKEILTQHFNNICVAVDKFVGTKQDHINLQLAIEAIKGKLFNEENNINNPAAVS